MNISLEILHDLKLYNPANQKIRLGRNTDGGYVIVGGYDYDYLISGGIGGDVSFEIDFIKTYPKVQGLIFDGTVNNPPKELPKEIQFIKKNVGSNNENTTDLCEYIKDYKDVFLKMDIEGGEFELLTSKFAKLLPNIKQIVFEAHYFFDIELAQKSFQNLNETHYLVHVHENNNGRLVKIQDTIYPNLLELTYIRKDCEINGLNTRNLPISGLDYPNVIGKIEHDINVYPFKWL